MKDSELITAAPLLVTIYCHGILLFVMIRVAGLRDFYFNFLGSTSCDF
jgi:hypothetical protein